MTEEMTADAMSVRKLLAPLRDRPVSVDASRLHSRRERILPSLRRVVAESHEQRFRVRRVHITLATLFGAAAAAAGVWFGVRTLSDDVSPASALQQAKNEIRIVRGSATASRAGRAHSLSAGQSLSMPFDGELSTESGLVDLKTSTGLALELAGETRVSLRDFSVSGTQSRVHLSRGEVTARVPRLEQGQQFSIVTPNARAVVHGTIFSVQVDSEQEGVTQTCVRVTEGVVVVHHDGGQAALNGGDSWGCGEVVIDLDDPATPEATARRPRAPGRPAATMGRGEASGTLAAENALLQRALAAERAGEGQAAVTHLQTLLSRYPESPLAPEARRTLARLTRSP